MVEKQIKWLLNGDPAIRYQVLRDVTRTGVEETAAERERILKQGWGRRLLQLQDKSGTWANALYSPKWTSTFYTMLLLKRFGAPPAARLEQACRILLDKGFYDGDGGINYWKTWKQSECCVTGMLLSILCHFRIDDDRLHRLVDYIHAQQMPDRGWNCQRFKGARHSSFHTTISVLEGLWEYKKAYPNSSWCCLVQQMQKKGIEFLLQHHLYKSDTTWKPVDANMTRLSFPPRWHYDIVRCLDYFQDKNLPKDTRMHDAVTLLLNKQTPEGLWNLEKRYPAKRFFKMESVGEASRWNTLRALRIMQWWRG